MDDREIILSKHATDAALDLDLDPDDVFKVVRTGERIHGGRAKARCVLRTKRGIIVAICGEYPDLIEVITVTKGR